MQFIEINIWFVNKVKKIHNFFKMQMAQVTNLPQKLFVPIGAQKFSSLASQKFLEPPLALGTKIFIFNIIRWSFDVHVPKKNASK